MRHPVHSFLVTCIGVACCAVVLSRSTIAQVASKLELVSRYGDGKADGKKSVAGSCEAIKFLRPSDQQQLRGVRIHGSRYGHAKAPDEDVEITVVDKDNRNVVHIEFVPYKKFKKGESRWSTIVFEEPVDVPAEYWVLLDFNAERTQGVYISFDTSTAGQHSKLAVPGGDFHEVSTGGDWMVQALLTRP